MMFRNQSGLIFSDISSEEFRVYSFNGKEFLKIKNQRKSSKMTENNRKYWKICPECLGIGKKKRRIRKIQNRIYEAVHYAGYRQRVFRRNYGDGDVGIARF